MLSNEVLERLATRQNAAIRNLLDNRDSVGINFELPADFQKHLCSQRRFGERSLAEVNNDGRFRHDARLGRSRQRPDVGHRPGWRVDQDQSWRRTGDKLPFGFACGHAGIRGLNADNVTV